MENFYIGIIVLILLAIAVYFYKKYDKRVVVEPDNIKQELMDAVAAAPAVEKLTDAEVEPPKADTIAHYDKLASYGTNNIIDPDTLDLSSRAGDQNDTLIGAAHARSVADATFSSKDLESNAREVRQHRTVERVGRRKYDNVTDAIVPRLDMDMAMMERDKLYKRQVHNVLYINGVATNVGTVA